MRKLRRLASTILLVAGFGTVAEARETTLLDVRDAVRQLAFDPTHYFPSPYVTDRSIVRVTYTGDDYGWPVYAFAVAHGCIGQEDHRQAACARRLRARMVRAPARSDQTRPRQRGLQLVSRLYEKGIRSPDEVRAALGEADVEWVEADLATCPGAMSALEDLGHAVWVPDAVAEPDFSGKPLSLVLHADIVRVEVQQYRRLATYEGWAAEGSPAVWANAFVTVLEPCWAPAEVAAPWSAPGED